MGHYSERVRKDALTGLASLLTSHPEELKRQVRLTPAPQAHTKVLTCRGEQAGIVDMHLRALTRACTRPCLLCRRALSWSAWQSA